MEREKTRAREPEAQTTKVYQGFLDFWQSDKERMKTARIVVKGTETPWENHQQGRNKFLIHPGANSALRTLTAFEIEIPPGAHGGMHKHMVEALLYILEGKGYSIVNGVRYEWEKGDAVCMPVGSTHQHGNRDPERPARVLAVAPMLLFQMLGLGEIEQIEVSPFYKPE